MLTSSFIGLVVDWTWQIAHRMLRGKVQMGTFEQTHTCWVNDGLSDCSPDDQIWGWSIRSTEILDQDKIRIDDDVLRDMLSLGARGGVPSRYIASTSQGNGQCTQHLPTRYISSTFRIFPTNFHAIFPAQEMISTFTVSQVM